VHVHQIFFGPNLQGKVVSVPQADWQRVHPHGRARVPFLGNWGDLDGGRGYSSILASVLRATTKKGRQLFW